MASAFAPELEPELVSSLELYLSGLVIIDRELEILRGASPLRAAALVGRAAGGELVLIEELEGPPEKTALRALELAALVREHAQELCARFDCARGPLLVLLASENARELGILLAPLLGARMKLFSYSLLRTHSGSRLGIAPVLGESDCDQPRSRAEFLESFDAPTRALAENLWERLGSRALGARAEIGGAFVRWSDMHGPLCSLPRSERGLSGRLSGLDEPIELANTAEVRGFLDAVLALHLERSLRGMESPDESAPQAAFDPRQPVLSQAEINAFHGQ
jgi:hypothetical protein